MSATENTRELLPLVRRIRARLADADATVASLKSTPAVHAHDHVRAVERGAKMLALFESTEDIERLCGLIEEADACVVTARELSDRARLRLTVDCLSVRATNTLHELARHMNNHVLDCHATEWLRYGRARNDLSPKAVSDLVSMGLAEVEARSDADAPSVRGRARITTRGIAAIQETTR